MDEGKLQVVVVDDDPLDCALLHRLLRRIPGWTIDVREYATTEEVVRGLAKFSPDVIFLDYDLQGTTGLEVMEHLNAHSLLRAPVIGLTGQGDESIAVALLKAGVYDYIPKSKLSEACLKRAVSNAIRQFDLKQALDLTHKNLEEQNEMLRRQKQEIQAFYHTLSHELKTPLTSLREFICILLDEIAGPVNDKQSEYLGVCKRSCDQLACLMNDLIDSSRIDTGKFALNLCRVSAQEIVNEVHQLESTAAAQQGVTLEAGPTSGSVMSDVQRSKQVLINLVSNALKFTPEGGRVTIEANSEEEGFVTFVVRDTGRGIPEHEHVNIFERLHQTCEEDAALHEGLGLGLNLCKQLVELQGGRIWLESTVGEGSAFFFTLPLAPATNPVS